MKVKITSLSSGAYDVNNQTNQIDNLISAGVDLIILGAADSKGIAPAVKRAKAAGIVVIAVDVGAEGGVDATVMSDNKQAGQQAGQYIVDKLKGKGQMVIVNGEKSRRSWLRGHERQEARTGNDIDPGQTDHPRECERVSRLDEVAKPTG